MKDGRENGLNQDCGRAGRVYIVPAATGHYTLPMRRLPPFLHAMLAATSLAVAAAYVVGRLLTDRFLVTQYVFWVPSMAYLAVALALGIGALIFGAVRLSALSAHARSKSRRAVRITRVALAACACIALHITLIEWRSWRYILPPTPAPEGRSLLVLHWNMTVVEPGQWQRFLDAMPLDPKPDVIVLTNPIWSSEIGELKDRLGPDYRVVRIGTFGLATRFAISASAAGRLGIVAAEGAALFTSSTDTDQTLGELLPSWSPIPRVGGSSRDPGHVMSATLDTTALLGRPFVVWGIDLPSDIRLSRYAAATMAAGTIDSMLHAPSRPIPKPDLIVGDFNTPRGSASLKVISMGYPHACEQAGRGYMASWPRQRRGPRGERIPNPFPIFHLDHAFVAPWLRAATYELIDPGIAEHYVQRMRITPRAGH